MRWFYCLILQFLITPFCYCTFFTSESFLAFPFPPPPFLNNTLPQGYNSFDTCLYGWILIDAELNQLASETVDYTPTDIANLQTQIQTMIAALNAESMFAEQAALVASFENMYATISANPIDVTALEMEVAATQMNLASWGGDMMTFPDGSNLGVPNVPTNPTALNVYLWFLHFYNYSFVTIAEGLMDPATYFLSMQSTIGAAVYRIATGTAFDPSILMCGQTGMDLIDNSLNAGSFSLDVLVAAMPYLRQVFLLLAPPGTFQ